jgi:predicted transcriptional regulator
MEVLDMKYTQVLFKFPKDLKKAITELAKKKNTTQSEIVREAIRRYIISEEFRMLREKTLAEVESKNGVLSDEDVFKIVS